MTVRELFEAETWKQRHAAFRRQQRQRRKVRDADARAAEAKRRAADARRDLGSGEP